METQQNDKVIRLLDIVYEKGAFRLQKAWFWKNERILIRIERMTPESWKIIVNRIKDLYNGSFMYTTEQIFSYIIDEPVHLTEEDYFILECLFHDSKYPDYPALTNLQKEFLKEMNSDTGNGADVISRYIRNSNVSWFHFFCKLFFSIPMSYFGMRWKGPAFKEGETFPPAWIDKELNRPVDIMAPFINIYRGENN